MSLGAQERLSGRTHEMSLLGKRKPGEPNTLKDLYRHLLEQGFKITDYTIEPNTLLINLKITKKTTWAILERFETHL